MSDPATAPSQGRIARRGRLQELIQRGDFGAILLRRPANFAWYTGGADNRVDRVAPDGVADIVVTADEEWVLTSTIEAPRMREEQTPEIEVVEFPWFEGPAGALRDLLGDADLSADVALPGVEDISDQISQLRRVLDPDAIERLRMVGRDASTAMAEVAATIEPGMSEFEAAANLAAACRSRDLDPTVLLAAADERIARHRHPIPVGARIERRAMLVASAERQGLYANLTKIVEIDSPGAELQRRSRACREILRRMREEATRAGRTLADAFDDCRRFYAEAGFPDEWRLHHQGGLSGYASREIIATPWAEHEIGPGQAFAWNPSVTGSKAEETFLLTETGPEVIASGEVSVA